MYVGTGSILVLSADVYCQLTCNWQTFNNAVRVFTFDRLMYLYTPKII